MAVVKSNHCAYNTHYHIVFPVKYRKVLLNKDIERAIVQIAQEIEDRFEIEFEEIGCDKDHIHILCSFHSKYAGGEIVRIFKSITARELFKRFPDVKKDLWGGNFWSGGYYFATVSERGNWEVVQKYVENQGKTEKEPMQLRLFT